MWLVNLVLNRVQCLLKALCVLSGLDRSEV